jgi:hypothetical protein
MTRKSRRGKEGIRKRKRVKTETRYQFYLEKKRSLGQQGSSVEKAGADLIAVINHRCRPSHSREWVLRNEMMSTWRLIMRNHNCVRTLRGRRQ